MAEDRKSSSLEPFFKKLKHAGAKIEAIAMDMWPAYILKEELRAFWNCTTHKEAEQYLSDWLNKAWISGISLVRKFANMIADHKVGILNYFNFPVTTGPVEGIDNKIKVLKRKAYGYRDVEYFKLRIYFLHESRYALIG